MNIGERIKQRRLELGLTQTELAEKMGYRTKSTICEVEKDGTNLTQNRVVKFADALGVTPSYLMGWEIVETGTVDLEQTKERLMRYAIEHEKMLEKYAALSKKDQKTVETLIDSLYEWE